MASLKPLYYPFLVEPKSEEPPVEEIKVNSIPRKLAPINLTKDIDPSWYPLFFGGFRIATRLKTMYTKAYLNGLKVSPLPEETLSVFSMPVENIKVVMIGQDPYPGWDSEAERPIANGKAFSTYSGKITASLERIVDAIQDKIGLIENKQSKHLYGLQGWIDQGVFLLNNTPVVYIQRTTNTFGDNIDKKTDKETTNPDSQMKQVMNFPKDCWKGITLEICKFILAINPNVQFMLIGAEAWTLERHLPKCVKAGHPSPRNPKDFTGDCFLKVPQINWRHL